MTTHVALLYFAPVVPVAFSAVEHWQTWRKDATKRSIANAGLLLLKLGLGLALAWSLTYLGLREASAREDEETAKYVVLAMLPSHPIKDSRELQQRVDKYLDARRRARAGIGGYPVARGDGSIGVDWSREITEQLGIKDKVDP